MSVPFAYRGNAQVVTGTFSDLLFDYKYTYVVSIGVAYTCAPVTVFDELKNSKNPVSRSVSPSLSIDLTAQVGCGKIGSLRTPDLALRVMVGMGKCWPHAT